MFDEDYRALVKRLRALANDPRQRHYAEFVDAAKEAADVIEDLMSQVDNAGYDA